MATFCVVVMWVAYLLLSGKDVDIRVTTKATPKPTKP
jgi:hypothetical protein